MKLERTDGATAVPGARDAADTSSATDTRCGTCGVPLACGARAGAATCWCAGWPVLPLARRTPGATSCLCPDCLRARLDELAT